MFNFLRTLLVGRGPGKRSTVGTRSVQLKFEPLESRCLLSAAASPMGELPPLTGALLTGASLEASLPLALQRGAPVSPPFLPLKPPSDGIGPGKGLELPPVVDFPPEPSSPGPLIDIGNFDATEQMGTLADGVTTKEVHDVLTLLAALQYLPNTEHNEVTGFSEIPTEIVGNPAPGAAQGDITDRGKEIGGMVALVRDSLFAQIAGQQKDTGQDAPLPGDAIQIDGIYDRFQAFEVSTTEAAVPPAPVPPVDLEPTSLPLAPAVATPAHDGESLPAGPSETGSSAGTFQGLEEFSEAASSDGLLSAIDSEPTTIPTLRAAAAAVFLVYAAHAVQPVEAKEADSDRVTKGCRVTLSRWTRNGRRWLQAARKFFVESV